MLRGVVQVHTKRVRWQPKGLPTEACYLFMFDDAVAVAPVDQAQSWLHSFAVTSVASGVSQALIGADVSTLAIGAVGKVVKRVDRPSLVDGLPGDLTVDQLGVHVKHAHAVAIADIASVRLTTSRLPLHERGGVDVRLSFVPRKSRAGSVDHSAHKKLRRRKLHITDDPRKMLSLLNSGALAGILQDKRSSRVVAKQGKGDFVLPVSQELPGS